MNSDYSHAVLLDITSAHGPALYGTLKLRPKKCMSVCVCAPRNRVTHFYSCKMRSRVHRSPHRRSRAVSVSPRHRLFLAVDGRAFAGFGGAAGAVSVRRPGCDEVGGATGESKPIGGGGIDASVCRASNHPTAITQRQAQTQTCWKWGRRGRVGLARAAGNGPVDRMRAIRTRNARRSPSRWRDGMASCVRA